MCPCMHYLGDSDKLAKSDDNYTLNKINKRIRYTSCVFTTSHAATLLNHQTAKVNQYMIHVIANIPVCGSDTTDMQTLGLV